MDPTTPLRTTDFPAEEAAELTRGHQEARMSTAKTYSEKYAELQREKPGLRIIATRGGGVYLMQEGENPDKGYVVDASRGVAYPRTKVQSILARGYWEPFREKIDPYAIAANVEWRAHRLPRDAAEDNPVEVKRRRLDMLRRIRPRRSGE